MTCSFNIWLFLRRGRQYVRCKMAGPIYRLIAPITVHSYLYGLFLLAADWIYRCINVLYIKMSARPGSMKLPLGLKKLVWSCMLQRGSRGSCNQSQYIYLLKLRVMCVPHMFQYVKCRAPLWCKQIEMIHYGFLRVLGVGSQFHNVFFKLNL